jgi:hypothetical protein
MVADPGTSCKEGDELHREGGIDSVEYTKKEKKAIPTKTSLLT